MDSAKKLLGASLDIVQGYNMIDSVKSVIESTRNYENKFNVVLEKANSMAEIAGVDSVLMPRQTLRNKVPATNA